MSRKGAWLVVVILAMAVAVPSIVYAATGTFTSSSSTPAVNATNSGSGRAVLATSNTGYAGQFQRTATSGTIASLYGLQKSSSSGAAAMYGYASSTGSGSTYGVYGRSNASAGRGVYGYATKTSGLTYGVYGRSLSTTDNATGVFGLNSAASGLTNGVWGSATSPDGAGVYGTGPNGGFGVFGDGGLGVAGLSPAIGDGTYGVASFTDLGVLGNVVGVLGNIAGQCTVANGTATKTCTFTDPFFSGGDPVITPIVVLTPAENPGAVQYWVSASTAADFTITTSANVTGDITFNYVAIGTFPTQVAGSAFGIASR